MRLESISTEPMELVFMLDKGMPAFSKNGLDNCHGGALATYVDSATAAAVSAFDKKQRILQSVKLDITYMSSGKIEDGPVEIRAIVDKIGNKIGFSKALIKNVRTNQIICEGTQVLAFGQDGKTFFDLQKAKL